MVLYADGSFSQLIQVYATGASLDSSSPVWSQIKRGHFVIAEYETETTAVLKLKFQASGVQTHESSSPPPGSSKAEGQASSEQLNQRWVAWLGCAWLLVIHFTVYLAAGMFSLLIPNAVERAPGSGRYGVGQPQMVSGL